MNLFGALGAVLVVLAVIISLSDALPVWVSSPVFLIGALLFAVAVLRERRRA
jgi:uncharacterized protein (DUF983 family)